MIDRVDRLTFSDFSELWLRDHAAARMKETGYRHYESVVHLHLARDLGDLLLVEISPHNVSQFVARQVESGLSPRTVRNELLLLRSMFKVAVQWGFLPSNPAAEVGLPQIARPQRTFLTASEMGLLIECTAPAWKAMIAAACLASARKGEILALSWPQISFENRTIRFDRSMRRGGIQDVKTSASRATVPMPETLASLLETRRSCCPDPVRGLVFCRRNGAALSDSKPNAILNAALERAGLHHVRFHDLRRSWCIAMIQANVPIRTILALGRWKSAQTFLDEYSEFLIASGDDAVHRLDEVVMRRGE